MKHLLLVFTVLAQFIFFAFSSIIGREYLGAEESNSFKIYCAVSALIGVGIVVWDLLFVKKIKGYSSLMYIIPIIIYILAYLRTVGVFTYVPGINRHALIFFCYSVPAIFIGTYLAQTNSIKSTRKWFDFSMLIISMGLLFSLPKVVSSSTVSLAGTTYQAYSYMASLCAGINFFELCDRNTHWRFIPYPVLLLLRMSLLIFQIICVFMGGGRGAALQLIVFPLFWLLIKKPNILLISVMSSLVVVFGTVFINHINPEVYDIITRGVDRAFSYIASSGIIFQDSSGRDLIYTAAFDAIEKKPLFGYGLLGYLVPENFIYAYSPHNIFLELLLQGGVVLLIFTIVLFIVLGRKFYSMISKDQGMIFLLPISLFVFVQLFFSADYVTSSLFWFIISFLISSKPSGDLIENRI